MKKRVVITGIGILSALGRGCEITGHALAKGKTGVKVSYNLDEAVKDADVINVLRIQLERQKENLFPSLREYTLLYGLNGKRLDMAKPDVLLLHPGPMNRGIEITSDVADGKHAVINEQVTNGIAVRMSVLYLLAGGEEDGVRS